MTMKLFRDRYDAGRKVAERLAEYENRDDVIVLALPRGGVPVGLEVARALNAPLDVFLVRKLGVPGQEELAMGSIATGGVRVQNEDVVQTLGISTENIERVARQEREELMRRESLYRGDRPPPRIKDRIVILVDDGLATGASMRAAVRAVKQMGPRRLVVAVPVADPTICATIGTEADEVACVETPEPLYGVGAWYEDFGQVTDDEVQAMLAQAVQE